MQRVSLADALLARRAETGGAAWDIRETLRSVRDGLQQVTDAAALRQLLAGLTEIQQQQQPQREEVSTVRQLVEIGKDLVGTPSEREEALKEELERMRRRAAEVEDELYKLKQALLDTRREERREERESQVTLVEAFSRMMSTFMDWQEKQRQAPNDDPLRQIGASVLQSFVNRSPADDLRHVTEVLQSLRELGLVHAQQPPMASPELLKVYLDYQLGLQKTEKEVQAEIAKANAMAERFKAAVPALGVIGTAVLSRLAGDKAATQAANAFLDQIQGDASQPEPQDSTPLQPQPQPQSQSPRHPRIIRCGSCGFEFVTRTPLKSFACPQCRQEMELPA
jgi:hypothetical protein